MPMVLKLEEQMPMQMPMQLLQALMSMEQLQTWMLMEQVPTLGCLNHLHRVISPYIRYEDLIQL